MLNRIFTYFSFLKIYFIGWATFVFLCGIFFNSPLRAQVTKPLEPKQPLKADWEKWLDNVPVSGNLQVGIMAGVDDKAVDVEVFTVFLPATTHKLLCVEVSSQDGRYEAKLEYELQNIKPGPISLRLPTAYKERLSTNYKAVELAILTRLNERCGDTASELFVVSGWNDKSLADTVSIFVNSRFPTFIIGSENGKLKHEAECKDLRGDITAYNLRCEIPASWITPQTNFHIRKRQITRGTIRNVDSALPLRVP